MWISESSLSWILAFYNVRCTSQSLTESCVVLRSSLFTACSLSLRKNLDGWATKKLLRPFLWSSKSLHERIVSIVLEWSFSAAKGGSPMERSQSWRLDKTEIFISDPSSFWQNVDSVTSGPKYARTRLIQFSIET